MSKQQPDETSRLRLRRLTLDDAPLMLAVWNDPAFVRFVGDRGIRSLDEARIAMKEGAMSLYKTYGYGPYGVILKKDNKAIGICGLFRRDGLDDPDIGFAILPDYCGQGYAFEAAQSVVDHSRADLGLSRLTAIVSPENQASVGLIRKLGLRFDRMHRMPDDDDEVAIYAMSLEDA